MNNDTVSIIKSIVKELHTNPDADRDVLSRRFQEIAHTVSAQEIAVAEQEAIEEGVPVESVRKLCDVHLGIFSDEAREQRYDLPEGHPISILYSEHDTLLEQIRAARKAFLPEVEGSAHGTSTPDPMKVMQTVHRTLSVMQAARRYFEKEENGLFPIIERYGITRPPSIMWSEHDEMRRLFREFEQLEPGDFEQGGRLLLAAEEILTAHIHKEETILFKTALTLIQPEEWRDMRADFDEIGYMHGPPNSYDEGPEPHNEMSARTGDRIVLPSGSFGLRELQAALNILPVDLTFVDADDRVAYFSETTDRIFPRARSVIGRTVQNCHPPKSLHVVEEILRSFKAGEQDSEEFYLHLGERYIHIRYFAVRTDTGEYLGCLEVSQDIAPIQRIEGEKRIL